MAHDPMQYVDFANLDEFRCAWIALKTNRIVFLQLNVPETGANLRVCIIRSDSRRGVSPKTVELRCDVQVSPDHRITEREAERIATAVLVCRRAVSMLCEAAGAEVTSAYT